MLTWACLNINLYLLCLCVYWLVCVFVCRIPVTYSTLQKNLTFYEHTHFCTPIVHFVLMPGNAPYLIPYVMRTYIRSWTFVGKLRAWRCWLQEFLAFYRKCCISYNCEVGYNGALQMHWTEDTLLLMAEKEPWGNRLLLNQRRTQVTKVDILFGELGTMACNPGGTCFLYNFQRQPKRHSVRSYTARN